MPDPATVVPPLSSNNSNSSSGPVLPPLAGAFFGGEAAATATATTTTLRSPLLPPLPLPDAGAASSRNVCESFMRAGSLLFSVNPELFSSAVNQLSAQLSLALARNTGTSGPAPSSSNSTTTTRAPSQPPPQTRAPQQQQQQQQRPPSPVLHIGGTPATVTRAPSPTIPQQQQQRRTAFRKYVLPGNVAECYQCMECNERRPENSFHTDHMHFGKKPRIRWYCPLCNAYFAVTHRSGHIKSRHPPSAVTAASPAPPIPSPAPALAPAVDTTGLAAAQKRAAESVANLAVAAAAAAAASTSRLHSRHASPTSAPFADADAAAAAVEDPFYLIPALPPASKRACVEPGGTGGGGSGGVGAASGTDSDSAPGTCAAATRTSSAASLFRTTSSGSRGYFDGDPAYSVPSPVTGMRMLFPSSFPPGPPP